MAKATDIVVVGAGPVGLWTAIQAKKRDPDLSIRLYERDLDYKRSHPLLLERLSTMLYSKKTHDPLEDTFYKEVLGKSVQDIFLSAATGAVGIGTNHLEEALKTYANGLEIETVHGTVKHPQDVMDAHPECRIFIAADGARSKMRTALMGEYAINDMPLQHIVDVKYMSIGHPKLLAPLGDLYKANKVLSHMVFEYIGKTRGGYTPVALRFFLDKKTYDQVPKSTFREPLMMNDARMPDSLRRDISTYMNIRQTLGGDNYCEDTARIAKLTLSMYAAKKFATMVDDRAWFLSGDAAMGVPYFRALNSGFFVGSQLGYILTRDKLSLENKVRAYNTVRPLDVAWEFTAARAKDQALKMYDQFRRASAKSPLEIVKWDSAQIELFQSTPHRSMRASSAPQRQEL